MNKKIVIIEDEVIIAENLRRILVKLGYNVISVANSFSDGVDTINSLEPDLYLVDINLKEGENNGIKLAKLINETSKKPIIYITSNADSKTVGQAKTTKPVGYILKPFNSQTIFSTLEIAFFNSENHVEGLTIRHKGNLVKVLFQEIRFIKANSVYVEIYTANDRYLHRASLKDLSKTLPHQFAQIHRSYIVNMNFIKSFNSTSVHFDVVTIPIGRTYKSILLNQFENKKPQ